MSIFDEIQGQAQQFGSQAAQGAVQQVQTALPGIAEQASQVVQQQIPVMQQVVQQAGHEVGRDVGAGARQGLLSDFSTTETVLLGAGVFAALTLVGVAAYRSTGSRSAPELPYYKDPSPTREIKLNALNSSEERVEEVDIEHIELDDDGYTAIGRYFGVGAPLFYYTHSVPNDRFVGGYENRGDYFRAEDRADAIRKMRRQFPNAKIA